MAQDATYDAAKARAFAERLLNTLNQGALCLMISVGHRVGLFDVLRNLPPATSAEITAKADLNERYVRDWLGASCPSSPDVGRLARHLLQIGEAQELWSPVVLSISIPRPADFSCRPSMPPF
jgi:hypothetical protein